MKLKHLSFLTLVAVVGCSSAQPVAERLLKDVAVAVVKEEAKTNPELAKVVKAVEVAEELKNEVTTNLFHVVVPGDTLWSIASKDYAGAPRAPRGRGAFLWYLICDANNLQNCDTLTPGQVLHYPNHQAVSELPASQVVQALNIAYDAR